MRIKYQLIVTLQNILLIKRNKESEDCVMKNDEHVNELPTDCGITEDSVSKKI